MDETGVIVRRGYNNNTISWKEAFSNFNDSISKKEFIKNIEGFFVSHNAERISLVQDVLNDLECRVAHLYIGIDVTNPGFDNHVDEDDVWFWQNKGISKWDFNNGDSYTLNEGDLIYVPKGVYHKVSTVEARFGISMSLK
jgi:mannose-6-phosphate isomerase-like protein (cupin superfamily)